MTALYIGSATDPLAHLSGLPVAVVNQDRGATVGPQRLEAGQQIEAGPLAAPAGADPPHPPRVEILVNQRAGSVGTSLATGVLQPALAVASRQIGRRLAPLVPAGAQAPATRLLLADPVTVTTVPYRPLPDNAGL